MEIFANIQADPSLVQFEAVSLHPITHCLGGEADPQKCEELRRGPASQRGQKPNAEMELMP